MGLSLGLRLQGIAVVNFLGKRGKNYRLMGFVGNFPKRDEGETVFSVYREHSNS